MNSALHDLFNQLRMITKIKQGQRLDTINGLTIYEDNIVNWIRRKWHHDDKHNTVLALQSLYRSIEQNTTILFKLPMHTDTFDLLISLASLLISSINGINNLMRTYSTYPVVLSSLEGLIKDYIIGIVKKINNFIPKEHQPDFMQNIIILTDNILYEPPTTTSPQSIPILSPEIKHSNPVMTEIGNIKSYTDKYNGTPLSEILTYTP